jgi:hypothetical protein
MPRLLPRALLLLLAAGAPIAGTTAQDPARAGASTAGPEPRGGTLPGPALAARDVAGVGEFGGALTAVGRSWRATFGERSVTFEPALGRDAPLAHDLTFATNGITRGDHTVLAASAATPPRQHDRTSVHFVWPDVTERFVAEAAGLKHSYVFAARPEGDGDLVVRIVVDGTLPPTHTADLLCWTDERGNGVRLGDVIGIDARGERCRGTARPVDGGIELRLPSAFVDRAAYPLELDPLIGTAIQAYQGVDADFPDVAYEGWSNTYMVAWTQFFGGGTTGIVASVWLADTLGFGYAFAVNQPGDEDSVRVTSIGGTGLFVLVWVNRTGNTSSICGLGVEPVQAQGTAVFPIDGPAGVESPVVSGEATASDDDCLVAWLDDTYGLLGCSVTIDLQFQVSATPIVQVAGGAVREPAFSKQGGAAGLHLLTWVDRPIGQPGWLRAQVIDHDFHQLGPGAWIQNTPQNCGFPAVDGDGFRFLVAWEEQEVANPAASDIRGRIVTVGPTGITSLGGVLDLAAVANDVDFACDVAMLGDRFGLCFAVADAAAPFFDDCYVRTLAADGSPIGAEHRLDVTLGTNYRYEHAPRLIGRRDGNPQTNADDGLVVFADQNVVTFDSDVGLQAVEALGPGGPITDLGGGCGPGGLAGSTGPFALGNAAAPLQLFGAQPLAVPFVLLGLPNARLSCGVCTAIDALASWFVPNTAGTAATTFAIPGDPSVLGFQFDFQFVSLNVLYVGCPLLPGLALSNIVRATVGN